MLQYAEETDSGNRSVLSMKSSIKNVGFFIKSSKKIAGIMQN